MTSQSDDERERLRQRIVELEALLDHQRMEILESARLYDELRELLNGHAQLQTQQIHNEKMAALGRLVASFAHEVNNPLQSVLGCLSLAEEELSGLQRKEKLDRYVAVAKTEVERICGLVGRMREFYRPAGKEMRQIDLREVLESVMELVHKELQHNKILVEREWPDTPIIAQVNPGNLKQVILNLVLNAVDAMPAGGTLRLSARPDQIVCGQDDQSRPAILIECSDTGKGMSHDDQMRLFEPFFTTKAQGSGLGLYISYGIITSHNGKMQVTSQLGKGTTFSILLPEEQPPRAEVASKLPFR